MGKMVVTILSAGAQAERHPANAFKCDLEGTNELIPWRKNAAYDYLHATWLKKGYKCVLSNQKELTNALVIDENFSAIVIMDLLLNLGLDIKVKQDCLCFLISQFDERGLVYFFADKALYPADVDTTALAISVLTKAGLIDKVHSGNGINEILSNTTMSGIIDTYFDKTGEKRGRADPVVCANALYAISLYGKESEAKETLDFVCQTLISESYFGGTRYYPSEDAFLFALSKLVESFPKIYGKFVEPLKGKIAKRIGSTEKSLDLAMRIIACNKLGIQNSKEKAKLASLQLEDGSWPAYSYFKGSNSRYFGSREVSTAFAIKALDQHSGLTS